MTVAATVHAVLNDASEAVVLTPGLPFTTYRLKLADQSDVDAHGGAVGDIIDCQLMHPANALAHLTPDDLERYQIQVVTLEATPEDQVEASRTFSVAGSVISCVQTFEAAPPAPVPEEVYAIQLLEQIRRDGRTDAVNTYVAGAGADVQLWFNRANIVRRDNQMLTDGWSAIALTDDQLDDTFRAADLIPL